MQRRRWSIMLKAACTVLAVTALILPASASAHARPGGGPSSEPAAEVLLSGLSSPKGLASTLGGDLVIGQGAFGPPGPVLRFDRHKGTTTELTGPRNVTDVATGLDGSLWAIGNDLVLYRKGWFDEALEPVLDIAAYQQVDVDPFDIENNPTETNPFGLLVLPFGDALLVDAAGNDLIRVTPAGDAKTVARWDVELVSTDHFPPAAGLPPMLPAEAVPTTVVLGKHGSVYVGDLKGFPFRPGSSRVWQVNPQAQDVVCSVNTPDDDCSVVAEGFTSVYDIAFDHWTQSLFVYELAQGGVLAFLAGQQTGDFPPSVLVKVKDGQRTVLADGLLSQAGGVTTHLGRVFVTDGTFTNGRLLKIQH